MSMESKQNLLRTSERTVTLIWTSGIADVEGCYASIALLYHISVYDINFDLALSD